MTDYTTDELRDRVYGEQGAVCGMPNCWDSWTDLAHILDASAGGPRTPENLIGLCRPCHGNYDQNRRTSHRALMAFRKHHLKEERRAPEYGGTE